MAKFSEKVYYDRILSEALVATLKKDYAWLIEFVKGHEELDFQTGHDPKSKQSWFSIYRGTGRLLTVSVGTRNQLKISADKVYMTLSPQIFEEGVLTADTLEIYLKAVNATPKLDRYYVSEGVRREGYYQNLIARRYTFHEQQSEDDFIVIDKEMVIGFFDEKTREDWNRENVLHQETLVKNLREIYPETSFPKEVKVQFGEFDFLGMNWAGDIIIMELKQNDPQKTYLSPIQISFYKQQFTKLFREYDLNDSIFRMIEQKIDLGIIQLPTGRTLPQKLSGRILSYIIVGEEDDLSQEVCRRYSLVKSVFDPSIEQYTCTKHGTLIPCRKLK